jgi:large subunit ribosomal protein L5e
MPFVKIQKNNTYFKRFQVKSRRRREGKTDYYQRKRLITQRKNKYNTPKWRFVVRRTNQRIICQVVWSTISGDKVKTSADSFELKRFGLTAGLTNYASAYATGLLCAKRLLAVLDVEYKAKNFKDPRCNFSKDFNLVAEATGEYINIAELAEKKGIEYRPFTCFLDLGLARATVGNRVFAALKGAVDGGLNIPHSDKIFPKAKKEEKGTNALKERIFGTHVQKYMNSFAADKDRSGNDHQFSQWKKCLNAAKVKTVEELYKKIHAEIRKNPIKAKRTEKPIKFVRDAKDKNVVKGGKKAFRRDYKITREQRRTNVNKKIAEFFAKRK